MYKGQELQKSCSQDEEAGRKLSGVALLRLSQHCASGHPAGSTQRGRIKRADHVPSGLRLASRND